MWLHFVFFIVIIIFCVLQKVLLPNSNKKRLLFWGSFIFFGVFIACRAYTVGNDTQEYYRFFKVIMTQPSISNMVSETRYEIGYVFLNYIVSRVTHNFTVLLIIITSFYLYSSFRLIRRYAKTPELAIVLMFTLSLFYFAMNIERQCIAMAIFYFAIPFLEKKKCISYCVIVIIASLFHKSAIILLILAFLPKINFTNKNTLLKWEILSFGGLIFLNIGITKILEMFPYFQHYYAGSIYSEGGIRVASVVFFVIRLLIVLLVKVEGGFRLIEDDISKNGYVFYMLLFMDLVVAAASIGFNLFDRIEKYFTLGYIIVITNAIYSLGSGGRIQKNNKVITTIIVISLTFAYITSTVLLRSSWLGIFPYSFV